MHAIALSHSKRMIAVAVREWQIQDYDQHDLKVLFYSIEAGLFFTLQSQHTIKVTKSYSDTEALPL